ncbi:hypothetical protein Hanom_Chr07g00679291 [Helianthus anomalus]
METFQHKHQINGNLTQTLLPNSDPSVFFKKRIDPITDAPKLLTGNRADCRKRIDPITHYTPIYGGGRRRWQEEVAVEAMAGISAVEGGCDGGDGRCRRRWKV